MKRKALVVIILVLSTLIVVTLIFLNQKAFDTNKIKIVLSIDENSIYDDDDIVNAILTVENNNKIDIIMFGSKYIDENLYFNADCEGTYIISTKDKLEKPVTFEFSENVTKSEYLSLINEKKLTFTFNKNEANQGENTVVFFDIGKGTISKTNE